MQREFGSGSAIHAYLQEWVQRGLFQRLWKLALERFYLSCSGIRSGGSSCGTRVR
jgi:transposase